MIPNVPKQKDVARLAEISEGIVSLALAHGRGESERGVSWKTARKMAAAYRKLGWAITDNQAIEAFCHRKPQASSPSGAEAAAQGA